MKLEELDCEKLEEEDSEAVEVEELQNSPLDSDMNNPSDIKILYGIDVQTKNFKDVHSLANKLNSNSINSSANISLPVLKQHSKIIWNRFCVHNVNLDECKTCQGRSKSVYLKAAQTEDSSNYSLSVEMSDKCDSINFEYNTVYTGIL